MVKVFYSIEETEKYYNKELNTYIFKENGEYIDLVLFNLDLKVQANIIARDISGCNINVYNINARNISAHDINAWDISADDISAYNIFAGNIDAYDINAWNISACNISAYNIKAFDINAWDDIKAFDINANNISYYAVCFAHKNIKCKSIRGSLENSKHFVLDGVLEIEEE